MELTDTQIDLILDVLSSSELDLHSEIAGYERSIRILSSCDMHKEAEDAENLLSHTRQRLQGITKLKSDINRQIIDADLRRGVTTNEQET